MTLEEFKEMNRRRWELIQKLYNEDPMSQEEKEELERLQTRSREAYNKGK